jgi:hypothetical protein
MTTVKTTTAAAVQSPPGPPKAQGNGQDGNDKNGQNLSSGKNAANIVAIVVLVLYVVVGGVLMLNVDLAEVTWSRMIFLYGGLEAIAFGAAGYFFGKEVHRERAEEAEKKATKAEETAVTNVEAKTVAETNFDALEKYIETHRPTASSQAAGYAELLNDLQRQPEMLERFSGLVENLRAKHDTALSIPDSNWDALQKYARKLRQPRTAT